MEYIVYLAIVTGLLILCACALHGVRREEFVHKPVSESDDKNEKKDNQVRLRELNSVPTPWGWPGSDLNGHQTFMNGSAHIGQPDIHRWVDGLVSEKQTKENAEYQRKREACLRALLEDRFHNSNRMSEIESPKTRPPRLRNPSARHDQMDNFPNGRLRKIEGKLEQVNGDAVVQPVRFTPGRNQSITNLRRPWGW